MSDLDPSEVAASLGLGRLRTRFPGSWFAQVVVAVLLAGFTGVLGFMADILVYKAVGSLAVVALIVWSVLIAKNKGFLLYDNGFIQVDALGRIRASVTWSEVIGVIGVRVDVTNGAFTVDRRDFTIVLLLGRQIQFNDILVRGGAQFAASVATMSKTTQGH